MSCPPEECESDHSELVAKVVYDLPYNGIGVGNDVSGRTNPLIDHDKEEPVCTKKVIEKTYSDLDAPTATGTGGLHSGVCVVTEIPNYLPHNASEKGVCKIF